MQKLPLKSLTLAAGLVALLGLAVIQLMTETHSQPHTLHPQGFSFVHDRRLDNQKHFTVEGELKNLTDSLWTDIHLAADIYADKAFITYCRHRIDQIPARSSLPFRIVCRITAGSGLPDNISYQLEVTKATRQSDQDKQL